MQRVPTGHKNRVLDVTYRYTSHVFFSPYGLSMYSSYTMSTARGVHYVGYYNNISLVLDMWCLITTFSCSFLTRYTDPSTSPSPAREICTEMCYSQGNVVSNSSRYELPRRTRCSQLEHTSRHEWVLSMMHSIDMYRKSH